MPLQTKFDEKSWAQFKWLSLVCACMLVVIGGLGIVLHRQALDRYAHSTQASAALALVHQYLQHALDAESGQRGFVLTGEKEYLQSYDEALRKLSSVREKLPAALAWPDLADSHARMEGLLDNTLSDMTMSIALYRESGFLSATDFMRAGIGKSLMDQLRAENARLAANLTGIEQRYVQEMVELRSQRDLFMLVALLIGLGSGIAAFLIIREHMRALLQEKSLRLDAARAIRESREKSVFLANLSHEIRTPMNAIFGFTQLLSDLVKSEREQHYVRAIRQSGDSLLTLINDILDLSKIESGRIDIKPAPTDIAELMSTAAMLFSQQASEKGLKLSVHADPGVLLIDALRVRQVIFNLMANALRYTDRGSVDASIRVQSQGASADMTLIVKDTGIGVAEADQSRIFDPFTQVDLADRDARGGSGLGLSIVSRLMEAMGGTIRVESQLGEGSSFIAHWPEVPRADRVDTPVYVSGNINDLAPLSIVGIDDVALNRELLKEVFRDTHHSIVCADSAPSGLKLIVERRPQLVLMDIRMPGMDGREALARIRSDPRMRAVRVVAVTASSLIGEEAELTQIFDGYVRKPITREALMAELRRLFAASPAASATASAAATMDLAAMPMGERAALQARVQALLANTRLARDTLSTTAVSKLEKELIAGIPALMSTHAERLRAAREIFDLRAMEVALEAIDELLQDLRKQLQEPDRHE